jgi:hypothetical protein
LQALLAALKLSVWPRSFLRGQRKRIGWESRHVNAANIGLVSGPGLAFGSKIKLHSLIFVSFDLINIMLAGQPLLRFAD